MKLIGSVVVVTSLLTFWQGDKRATELAERVSRMARIGAVSGPSFSPDGRSLSVISNVSGTPQVYVLPTTGGWPRMITDAADPVVGAEWSPAPGSDWLAITVAPGGGLNTQVYVVRADGTGLRRVTDGGQDNNAFNAWSDDGTKIYIDSNRRDPASRDSFVIDAATGKIDLVVKNPGIGSMTSVTADRRFGLLARLRSRGNNNLYLVDLASGADTLLTPHEGLAQYFGVIARDGRAIYLGTNEGRDLTAFGRVRLDQNGKAGKIEVLRERPDAELDGVRVNDQGTLAALLWNAAGRSELELFDLQGNKTIPAPKLPAEIAGLPVFSRDGKHMAVTLSGAAQPLDVWVADLGQPFRQVTFAQRAGVDVASFVRPELVTFRAHDGLELSGWLYRPKGAAGPAGYVVSFHGGPEGQERPGFRSDYQALLSQGIGVFAPNVRGSSGFGKEFVNLDNGELRFNGIKDIKSCVDYLVANRIADAKRIGIMGGSSRRIHDDGGVDRVSRALCGRRQSVRHGQLLYLLSADAAVDGGNLHDRIWRSRHPEGPTREAVPAWKTRPDSRRDDGAAWGQRYQRAGGRGGADRQTPQVARRSGGIHPVSRRGTRLAEDPEPDPVDGGDGPILRQAFESSAGERCTAPMRTLSMNRWKLSYVFGS